MEEERERENTIGSSGDAVAGPTAYEDFPLRRDCPEKTMFHTVDEKETKETVRREWGRREWNGGNG